MILLKTEYSDTHLALLELLQVSDLAFKAIVKYSSSDPQEWTQVTPFARLIAVRYEGSTPMAIVDPLNLWDLFLNRIMFPGQRR